MAKTKEPLEEMSALAAQTMEKTRLAADNYFNFLQKSMSSYPWGGTELGETLKHFAEQNVAAVHEFARKLSQLHHRIRPFEGGRHLCAHKVIYPDAPLGSKEVFRVVEPTTQFFRSQVGAEDGR